MSSLHKVGYWAGQEEGNKLVGNVWAASGRLGRSESPSPIFVQRSSSFVKHQHSVCDASSTECSLFYIELYTRYKSVNGDVTFSLKNLCKMLCANVCQTSSSKNLCLDSIVHGDACWCLIITLVAKGQSQPVSWCQYLCIVVSLQNRLLTQISNGIPAIL